MESVRDSATEAVDVEAQLSLRILGAEVDLAGGGIDPLCGDDEVVDELLHLLHDLLLLGQAALSIDNVDGAVGDGVDGLTQDPQALAHLLDTAEIAVVAVADRSHRDVEVVLLVVQIGVGLADIVIDAGAAEHWPGEAVGDGILLGDDPDILRPVHEDRIAGQEIGDLVEGDREALEEGVELGREALGKVTDLPADARVARGEAGSGQEFAEIIDLLALREGVEEDGDRPDVHGAGAEAEKVRRDPGKLTADHADRLAARGKFPSHQLLDGASVGDVVGERSQIVEPVRVGHELVVLHVLRDLLVPAVKVADLGLRLDDLLAVQIQDDAEDPVGGGMGWAEIQRHRFPEQFACGEMALLAESLLGAAHCILGLENGGGAHGR